MNKLNIEKVTTPLLVVFGSSASLAITWTTEVPEASDSDRVALKVGWITWRVLPEVFNAV